MSFFKSDANSGVIATERLGPDGDVGGVVGVLFRSVLLPIANVFVLKE